MRDKNRMCIRMMAMAAVVLCSIAGLAKAQAPAATTAPTSQPAADAAGLWQQLGDEDPVTAFRVAATMAKHPDALSVLEKQCAAMDPAAFGLRAKLIRDLDNDSASVRRRAQEQLAAMGSLVERDLAKALAGEPSFEQKTLLMSLLERIKKGNDPEVLRQRRAVHVLEMMDNPKATALLERLAKSSPLAIDQAKQALAAKAIPPIKPSEKVVLFSFNLLVCDRPTVDRLLSGGKAIEIPSARYVGAGGVTADIIHALAPVAQDSKLCEGSSISYCREGDSVLFVMGNVHRWIEHQEPQRGTGSMWAGANGTANVRTEKGMIELRPRISCSLQFSDNRPGENGPGLSEQGVLPLPQFLRFAPGKALCVVGQVANTPDVKAWHVLVIGSIAVPADMVSVYSPSGPATLVKYFDDMPRLMAELRQWNDAARKLGKRSDKSITTLANGAQIELAWVSNPAVHPLYQWDIEGNPLIVKSPSLQSGDKLVYSYRWRPSKDTPWENTWYICSDPGTASTYFPGGEYRQAGTLEKGKTLEVDGLKYTIEEIRTNMPPSWNSAGQVFVRMKLDSKWSLEVAVGAVDKKGKICLPARSGGLLTASGTETVMKGNTNYSYLETSQDRVDHYVLLLRNREPYEFKLPDKPKLPAGWPTTLPSVK